MPESSSSCRLFGDTIVYRNMRMTEDTTVRNIAKAYGNVLICSHAASNQFADKILNGIYESIQSTIAVPVEQLAPYVFGNSCIHGDTEAISIFLFGHEMSSD